MVKAKKIIHEFSVEDLKQIIAENLGVPINELSFDFEVSNTTYDDRCAPSYNLIKASVTQDVKV